MLSDLVARLFELYQPLYGHPDLFGAPARPCGDRLQEIVKYHDNLRTVLGRPLRVLDLGCAQGYFSLSLAERGASVLGIDIAGESIAVCQALAEEHPDFDVTFEIAAIKDVVARIQPGQFDLVLGLSVFHHLIHLRGIEPVRQLLGRIADLVDVLIIETALRDEPPYWATAQPDEPQSLLADIVFVREVARFPTHLSSIARPLYVSSNYYRLLEDRVEVIFEWHEKSHTVAESVRHGSRRYFYGDKIFVKKYLFNSAIGKDNRTDFPEKLLSCGRRLVGLNMPG